MSIVESYCPKPKAKIQPTSTQTGSLSILPKESSSLKDPWSQPNKILNKCFNKKKYSVLSCFATLLKTEKQDALTTTRIDRFKLWRKLKTTWLFQELMSKTKKKKNKICLIFTCITQSGLIEDFPKTQDTSASCSSKL